MNPKLTPERLARKALVYVRQSKPSQLINNQESTRLQFSLVDRASALGFQQVVIVDDPTVAGGVTTFNIRGNLLRLEHGIMATNNQQGDLVNVTFDASLALEFLDMAGPDVREGVAAIRERRAPHFGG